MRRRARVLRAVALAALALAGLAAWDARPADRLVGGPAAPVSTPLPGAPAPFTGEKGGCTAADPTGTGGCLTAPTSWMLEQVTAAFGAQPATCWSEHAWNPGSDHPAGRACDFFPGPAGEFAAGTDLAEGWATAEWLRRHADALQVRYVIWQGRIWVESRPHLGWAPYDGGGVYDPTDAVGGHFDHVHVSMRR
ncbi:hypothetical protein V5H98_00345 [Georgenia sp. M64]|uniref:hypothetical protein n=1 Tax=Georgenia sp. M64 TaxID=3120520 RepID=UPI0030E3D4EE